MGRRNVKYGENVAMAVQNIPASDAASSQITLGFLAVIVTFGLFVNS